MSTGSVILVVLAGLYLYWQFLGSGSLGLHRYQWYRKFCGGHWYHIELRAVSSKVWMPANPTYDDNSVFWIWEEECYCKKGSCQYGPTPL